MTLASNVAWMLASATTSVLLGEYLRSRLRERGTNTATAGKVGNAMSYDIVGGYEDDDDISGSIGADIIGADDDALMRALAVSGLGMSEIVGAANPALARRIRQRGAKVVRQKRPNTDRRYPLGFVPTSVGAGATLNVPGAPQNLFRPERLVIPSDIAFDFGVTDIKVGNTSQFVQNVEVPAALFSEVAINTAVQFDTAEVGNQISISIRNKSAGAVEFTAGAVGTIAK